MDKPPPSLAPCPSPHRRETGRIVRKLSLVCLLFLAVAAAPKTVVSFYENLTKNTVDNGAAPNLRASPATRFLQMDNENQTESTLMNNDTDVFNNCNPPLIDDAFCEINCAPEPESSWVSAIPLGFQILMIIFLICMSALFSGLTLGLMGLDRTGLEIVMEGDDPVSAANAKTIYPLRKDGNLLLCTLLLGNVAVNSLLSILLADKTGGAIGLFSSTFLIVIFGEILPQALCSRYALAIGSRTVPIVRAIVCLVYPIAKPLALCLDYALGDELATTYSGAEMLKLLQIHVQEGELDKDTADAMTGALKYKDMTVSQVMTPLENTFMLSVDEKLSFETIATIFKTGYSRIPIYEVSKNNVIGLLFTKDLIFIDPEDETPIRSFIQIFGRGLHVVWPVDKLGDVLRELKQGRSHLALVRDVVSDGETDPYYIIKGIITLEDIVEEILGHEIVDETDAFVDGTHQVKVNREEGFEWAKLRLLGSRIVDEKLSYSEAKAVTAHLLANYSKHFSMLTENQVMRMVSDTVVTVFPTATRQLGNELPDDLVYKKGEPTNLCTLILTGKMTVITGADEFRTDVGSWTLLGISALKNSNYVSDFEAFVCNGPSRCLQFTRESFDQALDASICEKRELRDDSFRNLTLNKPKASAPNSSIGLGSEADDTMDSTSDGGGQRRSSKRRSKFMTALQIVDNAAQTNVRSPSLTGHRSASQPNLKTSSPLNLQTASSDLKEAKEEEEQADGPPTSAAKKPVDSAAESGAADTETKDEPKSS